MSVILPIKMPENCGFCRFNHSTYNEDLICRCPNGPDGLSKYGKNERKQRSTLCPLTEKENEPLPREELISLPEIELRQIMKLACQAELLRIDNEHYEDDVEKAFLKNYHSHFLDNDKNFKPSTCIGEMIDRAIKQYKNNNKEEKL